VSASIANLKRSASINIIQDASPRVFEDLPCPPQTLRGCPTVSITGQ